MTRRPVLRFGTRSLLLLTTLACGLLGLWAGVVRPYSDQSQAVQTLAKLGAEIEIQPARGAGWRRWLVRTMVGPNAYSEAVSLVLRTEELPDRFGQRLSALPFLLSLELDRTGFDDADAAALAGLSKLERLSLRYTRVTDRGVEAIAGLTGLRRLRITGLAGVSDRGLARLAGLPRLGELYARWIGATAAGVADFVDAAPDCRLHTDLPMGPPTLK